VSKPLRKFLVRHNCEYTAEVLAETAEDAIVIAGLPETSTSWNEAWAPAEAEELEGS